MNLRLIVPAAALVAGLTGSVVSAQTIQPAMPVMHRNHLRNDQSSDRNLRVEIRRLERVIDMLQRDQRDYGGHRVQAIQYLQQARTQLQAGLQYDRGH